MIGLAPRLACLTAPGALSVRFQPVVERVGGSTRIHSVESLVRGPAGSPFARPDVLFEYVRRKRAEASMDRACVEAILAAAQELPASLDLSLNLHGATLHRDPEFPDFLRATAAGRGIDLRRLTVEIVEHAPSWADHRLREGLARLRGAGVRLALDDIGAGQSSLRMMLDIKPDFFKLDRSIVQGCGADADRRTLLAATVLVAERFGGQVVAEGVENEADLDAAVSLGIRLFQGHLFFPALSVGELAARAFAPALMRTPSARVRGSMCGGRTDAVRKADKGRRTEDLPNRAGAVPYPRQARHSDETARVRKRRHVPC